MRPRLFGVLVLAAALALLGASLSGEGREADRESVLLWIAAAAGLAVSIWALVSRIDRAAGRRLASGLGLLTVAAGSGRRDGLWLVAAAAVWALALLIMARWDGDRVSLVRRTTPRRVGLTLVALALVGAVAAGVGSGVPRLYDIITRAFYGGDDNSDAATGLDGALELGALDRVLQSQRVVLRVEGPAPDRLRGVVFDRYQRGRWRTAVDGVRRTVDAHLPPVGPGVVTARRVAPSARHLVVPLEATELGTETGALRRDRYGVVRALPDDDLARWWWRSGDGPPFAIDPPSETDTSIDAALAAKLRPLAESWAPPSLPAADRLRALESRLQREYRYSLSFQRTTTDDPVVEFLFSRRTGHCEYFASALALLARSGGVPARVVTGYRVAERSAVGGHYIVRDENAHAWVEAWVGPRGWQTFDATPSGEPGPNQPRTSGFWGGLQDWLRDQARRGLERARGLGVLGWLSIAAALAAAFFAQRLVRRRWSARLRAAPVRAVAWSAPLPAFARVEARLARLGYRRAPAETLESFATRLRAAGPALAAAADPILAYAALRYGTTGDRAAVEARLTRLAAALADAA